MPGQEITWNRSIDDFPHIIRFLGYNYEWIMYDGDPSRKVDMILIYAEIPSYNPDYYANCPLWHEVNKDEFEKCECGAGHTNFPTCHMFYCPRWRPW